MAPLRSLSFVRWKMEEANRIWRAVESEIRDAFRGVKLGRGVSLRQAQVIDERSGSVVASPFTGDWTVVPLEELERDCVAHLDAEGFRYYIPALMLSVIDHYEPRSMRVIGTLDGLYPRKDGWPYHMFRYSQLSDPQKRAIARFLTALPKLVELNITDQKIVSRALRNYWSAYLPEL